MSKIALLLHFKEKLASKPVDSHNVRKIHS